MTRAASLLFLCAILATAVIPRPAACVRSEPNDTRLAASASTRPDTREGMGWGSGRQGREQGREQGLGNRGGPSPSRLKVAGARGRGPFLVLGDTDARTRARAAATVTGGGIPIGRTNTETSAPRSANHSPASPRPLIGILSQPKYWQGTEIALIINCKPRTLSP